VGSGCTSGASRPMWYANPDNVESFADWVRAICCRAASVVTAAAQEGRLPTP